GARPWMGMNAIARAGPVRGMGSGCSGWEPVIDGCRYREALQAVGVRGGVAGNVVPDQATVMLNHRFAPDRDAAAAIAAVEALLAPVLDFGRGDRIEVRDQAPSALPGLGDPLLARL